MPGPAVLSSSSERRRRRRLEVSVVAVATSVGLWLGLTAPSVSPVTPTAPAGVAPGTTTAATDLSPGGADVVPPVPVDRGRDGRGPGGGR